MSNHEQFGEPDSSQPDQPYDQSLASIEASAIEAVAKYRLEQFTTDEAAEAAEAQRELGEQQALIDDLTTVLGPLGSLNYDQVKDYLAFRRRLNTVLDSLGIVDDLPPHLVRQIFENQYLDDTSPPSPETPQ